MLHLSPSASGIAVSVAEASGRQSWLASKQKKLIWRDRCQIFRIVRGGRERPAIDYIFHFTEERLQSLVVQCLTMQLTVEYFPDRSDLALPDATRVGGAGWIENPLDSLLQKRFLDLAVVPLFQLFSQLTLSSDKIRPIVGANYLYFSSSGDESTQGVDE